MYYNMYLILLSFYTQKSQQISSLLYNGANGVLNSLFAWILGEFLYGYLRVFWSDWKPWLRIWWRWEPLIIFPFKMERYTQIHYSANFQQRIPFRYWGCLHSWWDEGPARQLHSKTSCMFEAHSLLIFVLVFKYS